MIRRSMRKLDIIFPPFELVGSRCLYINIVSMWRQTSAVKLILSLVLIAHRIDSKTCSELHRNFSTYYIVQKTGELQVQEILEELLIAKYLSLNFGLEYSRGCLVLNLKLCLSHIEHAWLMLLSYSCNSDPTIGFLSSCLLEFSNSKSAVYMKWTQALHTC